MLAIGIVVISYYTLSIDEEIKAQKDYIICLRSDSKKAVRVRTGTQAFCHHCLHS